MNQPGGDAELANLCYARVHAVREKQRGTARGTDPDRRDLPAARGPVGRPGDAAADRAAVDRRPDGVRAGRAAGGGVSATPSPGRGVDLERFKGYGRAALRRDDATPATSAASGCSP